jgi:hypothetical protein
MAKTSTSFQKGHKGYKKKGDVSTKTKMWEALGEYIVNEGSERAMSYLKTLNDKDFLLAFNTMLEYFKPKQSRQDINQTGSITIKIKRGDE